MASGVTRSEALRLALLGAGGLAVAGASSRPAAAILARVSRARPDGRAAVPSSMAAAALRFLESLDDETRRRATYGFDDSERVRWHWTIPESVPRNGLPLREMTPVQRRRALELLRASSSAAGYRKSLDIVRLQGVLRQAGVAGSSFDPDRYYVTVFGNPRNAGPWGWRFEGHHLSRHFTVADGRLSVYPFFLGAWPTRATSSYGGLQRGYRTMPREEDAARELVRSLGPRQRRLAVFQQETLTDHVTQNRPRVVALKPVGVAVGDLVPAQRRLVTEIVRTYLSVLPDVVARSSVDRIERAGLERIRIGWAGSLEPNQPHYYRLQGPTFLLEFDNSRNQGTHIHSVWRDFREDFGRNLA